MKNGKASDMKENKKKKRKINARLKGLLTIILSALSIIVAFILIMIVYKSKNNNYRNPRIIAFLLFCLLACLLWLFYGIVLTITGDKTNKGKIKSTDVAVTENDESGKDDKAKH